MSRPTRWLCRALANRGGLTLILLVIYRAVNKGMDQSERPL
jgi:hypothetical protein